MQWSWLKFKTAHRRKQMPALGAYLVSRNFYVALEWRKLCREAVKFLLMKPIKDMVQAAAAAAKDIPTVLRFFFCSFIYLSQTEHVPCVVLSTQPGENLFSLSRTWFIIFFISNSVFLIAFFRQTQDDINFKRISLRWKLKHYLTAKSHNLLLPPLHLSKFPYFFILHSYLCLMQASEWRTRRKRRQFTCAFLWNMRTRLKSFKWIVRKINKT